MFITSNADISGTSLSIPISWKYLQFLSVRCDLLTSKRHETQRPVVNTLVHFFFYYKSLCLSELLPLFSNGIVCFTGAVTSTEWSFFPVFQLFPAEMLHLVL